MTRAAFRAKTARTSAKNMPSRPLKLWVESSSEQEVRIEIIPLIDVIFCILTFFILAAVGLSRQQAINLDLPQARTGKPQSRELLIVVVDDLGRVFIEDQLMNSNKQLANQVETYLQSQPDGLMALYASKTASYENVINVLDALREVGGDRVALATLPEGTVLPSATEGSSAPQTNPTAPLSPYGTPSLPGGGLPNNQFPVSPNQPRSNPLLPSAPGSTPNRQSQ